MMDALLVLACMPLALKIEGKIGEWIADHI